MSAFIALVVQQFMITAAVVNRRMQTQTDLNQVHAEVLSQLNSLPNIRCKLGINEDSSSLGGQQSANTGSSAGCNVPVNPALVACLGGTGSNCIALFQNTPFDLGQLMVTAANAAQSRDGSALCLGDATASRCAFSQKTEVVWSCPTDAQCSQLELKLTTTNTPATKLMAPGERPDSTRYKTLTSVVNIPARSLLTRNQINYQCALNPADPTGKASFISYLNYTTGSADCDPVIPGINESAYASVPAGKIAGIPHGSNPVNNTPGTHDCSQGFNSFSIYGSNTCLAPDTTIAPSNSYTYKVTPVVQDPVTETTTGCDPATAHIVVNEKNGSGVFVCGNLVSSTGMATSTGTGKGAGEVILQNGHGTTTVTDWALHKKIHKTGENGDGDGDGSGDGDGDGDGN